jgi:hypothetical protein
MGLSINVLFALLWCALGAFALRVVFGRFFAGRGRADVAAVAVVLAFAAGAFWPFSERLARVAPAPQPSEAPLAPAAPAAAQLRDRSNSCRTQAAAKPGGVGSFDVLEAAGTKVPIATGASISTAQALRVLGWAADRAAQAPATGVCLLVDGTVVPGERVRYGGARPDVVAAYHRDALLNSAFELDVPPGLLRPGQHTLRIAARSIDGAFWMVPGERSVKVR